MSRYVVGTSRTRHHFVKEHTEAASTLNTARSWSWSDMQSDRGDCSSSRRRCHSNNATWRVASSEKRYYDLDCRVARSLSCSKVQRSVSSQSRSRLPGEVRAICRISVQRRCFGQLGVKIRACSCAWQNRNSNVRLFKNDPKSVVSERQESFKEGRSIALFASEVSYFGNMTE